MLPKRLADIEWLIFPANVPRQYRYFRNFKTLWHGKLWIYHLWIWSVSSVRGAREVVAWACWRFRYGASWKPTAPGDKEDYWPKNSDSFVTLAPYEQLIGMWSDMCWEISQIFLNCSTYCAECRTEGALRAEVPVENNRIKKEAEGNVNMINDSSTQLEQRGRTAFFYFRSWCFRASLLSSIII